jgi:hypothetical protein
MMGLPGHFYMESIDACTVSVDGGGIQAFPACAALAVSAVAGPGVFLKELP